MSDHRWQQFTECCLKCGFNAYDPQCPDKCPGSHKAYDKAQERKKPKEEPMNEWPDF